MATISTFYQHQVRGNKGDTKAEHPKITCDQAQQAKQDNYYGAGGGKRGDAAATQGAPTQQRWPDIVCHASDLHLQQRRAERIKGEVCSWNNQGQP